MLRNVFLKSLRDQRGSLAWWVVGLAGVTLLTILFYPSSRVPPISTNCSGTRTR